VPTPGTSQIEVENCTLSAGSTGITFSTATISGSTYITQPTEVGIAGEGAKAVCDINVAQSGKYVLQFNANAADEGANSIFYNIDADPINDETVWDMPIGTGFNDLNANWRGPDGNFEYSQFIPKLFSLSEGSHKVIIRGREVDARINSFRPIFVGPIAPILCNDFTGDNMINVLDLVYVAIRISSVDMSADINNDGVVDISDLVIIVSNFGHC
jgi:hypothetical protein